SRRSLIRDLPSDRGPTLMSDAANSIERQFRNPGDSFEEPILNDGLLERPKRRVLIDHDLVELCNLKSTESEIHLLFKLPQFFFATQQLPKAPLGCKLMVKVDVKDDEFFRSRVVETARQRHHLWELEPTRTERGAQLASSAACQ